MIQFLRSFILKKWNISEWHHYISQCLLTAVFWRSVVDVFLFYGIFMQMQSCHSCPVGILWTSLLLFYHLTVPLIHHLPAQLPLLCSLAPQETQTAVSSVLCQIVFVASLLYDLTYCSVAVPAARSEWQSGGRSVVRGRTNSDQPQGWLQRKFHLHLQVSGGTSQSSCSVCTVMKKQITVACGRLDILETYTFDLFIIICLVI